MGIVNVTPDSFSDGGKFASTDTAIQHGLQLIAEGADILDIGGESTRPSSVVVSPDEEQRRILPVIEGLRNAGALISVDTRNASTMTAALKAGAGMINDISALTHDKESINVLRDSDCRICLMHMQGTPQTMQVNPHYNDVVAEVYRFLEERIQACVEAEIAKDRLMIDVGIGFGKTLDHNLALLKNMSKFHDLGVDILLGVSRKRFIEQICGRDIAAEDRLAGSLAALAHACRDHLQIVRVHDVAATRQFIDVIQKTCV
ncbi:MAG: dihydropteroate synthase [Alphaproteobacteria bacterium RIFCSPHIGHO2_12_FULL_45_9]|nr:MAG: dihydropteroate synthase [Alphaproteobacteria bacterium RIFCSPHIGHO2_02_FULL_46_13]OFW96979.1 MAG: dihydropteroate synthase [Alphaproteobacteria bacterium RIFCSPHIGHO2_12_FULL_45_9]